MRLLILRHECKSVIYSSLTCFTKRNEFVIIGRTVGEHFHYRAKNKRLAFVITWDNFGKRFLDARLNCLKLVVTFTRLRLDSLIKCTKLASTSGSRPIFLRSQLLSNGSFKRPM